VFTARRGRLEPLESDLFDLYSVEMMLSVEVSGVEYMELLMPAREPTTTEGLRLGDGLFFDPGGISIFLDSTNFVE